MLIVAIIMSRLLIIATIIYQYAGSRHLLSVDSRHLVSVGSRHLVSSSISSHKSLITIILIKIQLVLLMTIN